MPKTILVWSTRHLLVHTDTAQQSKSNATPAALSTPSNGDDIVESVHLTLQSIRSTSESRVRTSEEEDTSADVAIEPYDLLIHEFYNVSSQEVLAACLSDYEDLDILFLHLYDYNATTIINNCNSSATSPQLAYRAVGVMCNDTDAYQRYLEVWRQSRFLSQRKSIVEDWQVAERLSQGLEPIDNRGPVDRVIFPSMERMLTLRNTDNDSEYFNFLCNDEISSSASNNHRRIFNQTLDYYRYRPDDRSVQTSLAILKNFSLWFREEFPYYRSRCVTCNNLENNSYLGAVYSTPLERIYHAGRTELYHCGHCRSVSRFARYNDVRKVLQTRRGRCGEYSVLMMMFLRTLGYEARWVVDRDDHAWTEVYLPPALSSSSSSPTFVSSQTHWYAIDPCEATVHEPFIYQTWGKNQTFIFALHGEGIEDVTFQYTTNATAVIARRLAENINGTYLSSLLQQARDLALKP